MSRVHPTSCKCRTCKRKKKATLLENKLAMCLLYSLFFILIAI